MARAIAVLLVLDRLVRVAHVELGQSEEHDLVVGRELHFDERVLARHRGDDRVHDARRADVLAMNIRVIRRFIAGRAHERRQDRKSTRLNSSHVEISYAVFCLKKKKQGITTYPLGSKNRTTKI